MELEKLFSQLWKSYTDQNPSTQKIYDLFKSKGENVVNDHIAFRTFNNPKINISVLSKLFLESGYEAKGSYLFEKKHLNAVHYEHKTDKTAPRIFISELILSNFSKFLQKTINEVIDSIPKEKYENREIIFKGRLWEPPSYVTYEKLREESEYAAWIYVYGFMVNHFTVSVDQLKNFSSLQDVNDFLKENGFRMNTSGGEIKGTPEQLLEQSSTMAEKIDIQFKEGTYKIPACYYEFARRYKDKNGNIFSGFITNSADKIFESTNYYRN